jgi:hypothetical protein
MDINNNDSFIKLDDFYDNYYDYIKSLGFNWLKFLVNEGYIVKICSTLPAYNPIPQKPINRRYSYKMPSLNTPKKICQYFPNTEKLQENIHYIKHNQDSYYNKKFLFDILDTYKKVKNT